MIVVRPRMAAELFHWTETSDGMDEGISGRLFLLQSVDGRVFWRSRSARGRRPDGDEKNVITRTRSYVIAIINEPSLPLFVFNVPKGYKVPNV